MSGSQKLILYVEITLLIIGIVVFLFAPSKKINLTPYNQEFNKYESQYNLLSGLTYKILMNDMSNLNTLHEKIKRILEANDQKTDINSLIETLNNYKRTLDTINNNAKIYKALINKFGEALQKIDNFSTKNKEKIKKFKDLQLKLNTSESIVKSLWENAKKALSMQELSVIQSSLTEQLGIIDSFPMLLASNEEKIHAQNVFKQKTETKRKALLEQQKKAAKRRQAEKLAAKKKAAEEKAKEKIKAEEVKYTPPQLLRKAEPDYPDRWRNMGVGGKVKLKLTIASNGHVESVRLIRSTGNDTLDKNAINAAKNCLFIPAKSGNKTVESEYIIQYEFVAD